MCYGVFDDWWIFNILVAAHVALSCAVPNAFITYPGEQILNFFWDPSHVSKIFALRESLEVCCNNFTKLLNFVVYLYKCCLLAIPKNKCTYLATKSFSFSFNILSIMWVQIKSLLVWITSDLLWNRSREQFILKSWIALFLLWQIFAIDSLQSR